MTNHRDSRPQNLDIRRLHDEIKSLSREYNIPVIMGPKPMTRAETIHFLADRTNESEDQNCIVKIIKRRS